MTFTLKDLPLINKHGLRRWDIIDDSVKREVKVVILEGMRSGNVKEKIMAGALALRVDALNLKHEQMYVPKVDMDLSMLTDEQLSSFIEDMSTKIPMIEALKMLKYVDPIEYIDFPAVDADDMAYVSMMRDNVQRVRGGNKL